MCKLHSKALYLSLLFMAVTPSFADKLNLALPEQIEQTEQQSVTSESLSLEQALRLVEQDNPGLAEMQARAEAMAAIPSQAGTLPDPVISFGLVNMPVDSFDIGQEPMTQWQLGVSQQLPYPGKLALQEKTASLLADAAIQDTAEFRQHLLRDVKTLWWRLFYLDKTIGIVDLNKTLLRQFVEIAQTKYRVGQGLQQDVLLAQLELSKLIDRDIQLISMREQEAARLNALLNRPTDTRIKLPQQEQNELALPALKPRNEIFELAKENRPVLEQQRRLVDAAQTRKQLAEKDLLPDFNLSAGYGLRQGHNVDRSSRSDFLSLQLGVSVPLFAERKQKMAISQRNSEVKQQQFALQDEWTSVQSDISTAITAYQQARKQQALLQTGIIPQARQTVASMLAGYQVNKVDFLNLVRAQITLYNYETTLWQVISEAKTTLAKLTASVGEDDLHE